MTDEIVSWDLRAVSSCVMGIGLVTVCLATAPGAGRTPSVASPTPGFTPTAAPAGAPAARPGQPTAPVVAPPRGPAGQAAVVPAAPPVGTPVQTPPPAPKAAVGIEAVIIEEPERKAGVLATPVKE